MRFVVAAFCLVLLAPAPGFALQNNGANGDDVANLCLRAHEVCMAACQRPNTVSGKLQEGFCQDDCNATYLKCTGQKTIVAPTINTDPSGLKQKPAGKN